MDPWKGFRKLLDPVVQRQISGNLGLNFNTSFHFLDIFSILFRASSHYIIDKENQTEFFFRSHIRIQILH